MPDRYREPQDVVGGCKAATEYDAGQTPRDVTAIVMKADAQRRRVTCEAYVFRARRQF